MAGKSRISSSYRSSSSSLKGASKARTLLNSLALPDAGSSSVGCISDRMRAAPMGKAEEGAIDSERASSVTGRRSEDGCIEDIHLGRCGISRGRQS